MQNEVRQLQTKEFPLLLEEMPDPPAMLYARGKLPEDAVYLTVIGSRRHSPYAREACEHLIGGLAGMPVAIISGLALGIDGIAHKAALKAGLVTIAIPGSGLNDNALYPASHRGLAQEILHAGGALLSEYDPDHRARPEDFPRRNRLMAGMTQATLVIEAGERSGTLITARLAADYNREVLVVPHPIFSQSAQGNHLLLRLGATPVTESVHIAEALGIEMPQYAHDSTVELSPSEKMAYALLDRPQGRDQVIRALNMPVHEANTLLAAMELKGLIAETGGEIRRAR